MDAQSKEPALNDHSFSWKVAREYGVTEAILLKYLEHRLKMSNNIIDNAQWYYDSLSKIAAHYPYLSRSTVAAALDKLKRAEVIAVDVHNRISWDRTRWYAFTQKGSALGCSKDLLYFNPATAKDVGICAALIVKHVEYKTKTSDLPHPVYVPVSPRELARKFPFSAASISRTLNALVERGKLIPKSTVAGTETREYAIGDAVAKAEVPVPNVDGPVADQDGPVAKDRLAVADQYDNTSYKQLKESLKKTITPWLRLRLATMSLSILIKKLSNTS
jgi:hypothetical protein